MHSRSLNNVGHKESLSKFRHQHQSSHRGDTREKEQSRYVNNHFFCELWYSSTEFDLEGSGEQVCTYLLPCSLSTLCMYTMTVINVR